MYVEANSRLPFFKKENHKNQGLNHVNFFGKRNVSLTNVNGEEPQTPKGDYIKEYQLLTKNISCIE